MAERLGKYKCVTIKPFAKDQCCTCKLSLIEYFQADFTLLFKCQNVVIVVIRQVSLN